MPERYQKLVRLVCIVLGALLLVQLGRIVVNRNPLAHLQIPAVPTLTKADAASGSKSTNAAPVQESVKKSTNIVATAISSKETNATVEIPPAKSATNAPAGPMVKKSTTNAPAAELAETLTNSAQAKQPGKTGSNVVVLAGSGKPDTNSQSRAESPSGNKRPGPGSQIAGGPPGMPGGMPPGMMPGMPAKLPDLPPDIWARVDRIVDSEILGPVMRPLPMALLGIAGNVAFLRASNGQTGLVKEGDDLGGLKLLRIGINRVLVEEEGKKQELMIYSGMGGESLLPK
jgi:hypothetical protein